MKRLYIVLALVTVSCGVFAQASSCAQSLRLAQSIYDQGRLHELEDLITKAMGSQATPCSQTEQVSLLKLLTLAYIYLEEPEKADASMLKILQTDNYFEINPAVDPAEFVALYRTFRTKEIYRIGATLGTNATQPNVANSVTAVELAEGSKYKYGIALQFGAVVDVPLRIKGKYDLTLHGELLYMNRRFEIDQKVLRGENLDGTPLIQQLQGFESQNWISIPLSAQYRFLDKKINPYVSGGVVVDLLLGDAELQSERFRDEAASLPETTFELTRERLNLSAMLATGIKLKAGGGFFIAEIRYTHGLTNVSSTETAFENQRAIWGQYYADPVFKVSSLSLSGSYVINIFNPKKAKLRL